MLAAVVLGALLALPAAARAGDPPLQFGMYPGKTFSFGGYVGQPGNARGGLDLTMDRMVELANGRPFQFHTYAQWNVGYAEYVDGAVKDAVAHGLEPNVALKYVPPAGEDGNTDGFAAWVGAVVAAHPEVKVWQITNEANVNLTDDSDGGSTDPVGALIKGVVAAAAAKAPGQKVGFNWFYRLDPKSDMDFWTALGDRGGQQFRDALDYAGVDVYSGTYVTPLYNVDDRGDFARALDYVRNQMMPLAGLGPDVPIYVQEAGYPTLDPVLRSEARQAKALGEYIEATDGFNVALLQWFELTDADSTLGDGWGVVRPDFSRKPAFCVMRDADGATRTPGAPCGG